MELVTAELQLELVSVHRQVTLITKGFIRAEKLAQSCVAWVSGFLNELGQAGEGG